MVKRERKPSEGGALGFVAGTPPVGARMTLGLSAPPTLARGARLLRGAGAGFAAGASSCFACEEAVGTIKREEPSSGLLSGFVDLASDSCLATYEAVGRVRCADSVTGRVGERRPLLEGGDGASPDLAPAVFASELAVAAVRLARGGRGVVVGREVLDDMDIRDLAPPLVEGVFLCDGILVAPAAETSAEVKLASLSLMDEIALSGCSLWSSVAGIVTGAPLVTARSGTGRPAAVRRSWSSFKASRTAAMAAWSRSSVAETLPRRWAVESTPESGVGSGTVAILTCGERSTATKEEVTLRSDGERLCRECLPGERPRESRERLLALLFFSSKIARRSRTPWKKSDLGFCCCRAVGRTTTGTVC